MLEQAKRILYTKDIRRKLIKDQGIRLSLSKVRRVMIKIGYRWKKYRNIQCYVNTDTNVHNRKEWSKRMVKLMEKKKKFLSLDESSFNQTRFGEHSWSKVGT